MKLGLCLTGGGAKGAFQAGAALRFYENNIIPEITAGTSIGAVNIYFMLKGCYNELKNFWCDMDLKPDRVVPGRVVDNSQIEEILKNLSGDEEGIRAAYVNYVHIENRIPSEVVVNIKTKEKEAAIAAVKYSSLLPARPEDFALDRSKVGGFNSKNAFDKFKEDMANGIYDGYNLDGGILNNNLLMPFVKEKAEKIIVIALYDTYELPEYIYEHYNKNDIFLLKPDIKIQPGDTVRFQKTFCRDMYERGYNLAGEIINWL